MIPLTDGKVTRLDSPERRALKFSMADLTPAELDAADKDLMGQLARFAERRAVNGVLMESMISKSLGAPVLLVVALGEQALAVQQILMSAAVPDEETLIDRPSVRNFLADGKSSEH